MGHPREWRRALSIALHTEPMPLAQRLAQLRYQANAYRTQAIMLNTKLAAFEARSREVRTLREELAESSVRIDRAVTTIIERCTRKPR